MRNSRNLLKLPENKDTALEGKVLGPSTARKTLKHEFSADKNTTTTPKEIKTLAEAVLPQELA